MKKILIHLKNLDWILIIASVFLAGFGILSIYSSSLAKNDFFNFEKQIVFFIFGIFLMFLISFFDWRHLKENSYLVLFFYIFLLFLLVGLFFFAPQIRGVKSWYKISFLSFDPIEFIKLILIILLAKYFSARHIEMYRIRHILISGLYVLIPAFLIFFQPNLGACSILIILWIVILLFSGIKLRHFLIICLLGLLFLGFSWLFLLKDYQKERVIGFFYSQDPLGIDWSQNQAKIAIGSAGIFGQGIGKGSQTQYGFLPETQTDFIFSAIAEETGFIGVSFLFFLFLLLIWRIYKLIFLAPSNFPRLFILGFTALLVTQIFIHIGMNLGLLPVIGIALPFVSYGGSGLFVNFIGLGILQSIKTH